MSVGLGSSQLNGRNGAPATSSYVVIGADGALTNERQLTGTANQVIVTDNGAGSTVVLSTPQNIHTAASPTFAGATLTGLTSGRVPFVSTGGLIADVSTLTWDNTLARLAVGTLFDTPDQTSLSVARTYTGQTFGNMSEEVRVSVRSQGSGNYTTGRIGFSARMTDGTGVVNKTITGAANNGSGLIRITAASHGFSTGDLINIYGVGGTTEAIGSWTITVITANTFDLVGSTFTNAYTSGGIATNRGLMYAFRGFVSPSLDRGGPTTGTGAYGDDVNLFAGQNVGSGKATEAVYVAAGGPSTGSQWYAVFSSPALADYGLLLTGEYAATSSNTGLPGAAVWVRPSHTTNNTTTETYRNVYVMPTLNFGGSNANKTLNLLELDTTNTVTTGATVNLIKASYGGSARLNLSSAGLLTLTGSQTISGDLTVDTDTLYADSTNNRVGIGTASPAGVLHMVEESTENPIADKWVSSTGAMSWQMRKGRGSVAAPRRVQSGDVLGGFLAFGAEAADDVSTAAFPSGAAGNFRFITTEAHTTTAHGTKLTIQTAAISSTTLTQRIQIDEWGLRIGSSPASRGTTQGTNQLELYDGTAPAGTLTNGVALFSASGKLKSADAAGTVGHVVAASAVNTVSPTAPNRTITVDIGGTTYYIHAKTTND